MGPVGSSGTSGLPTPPTGFTPSANPTLAQNSSTGEVAHLDPITNTWSTETPPTDFVPDPSGSAPLTYTNPTTGQQLIYTGYDIWIDPLDHRPPIFRYDAKSGRTAYYNPATGQWTAPTPPPGYWVDQSQKPSRLGFFFINNQGDEAYYSTRDGGWTNWDTGQPIPVTTADRPETRGDAGRVVISGPVPQPGPETLAHNSPYSSRLMALIHGDQSVPTGNPAKDYQRDVQNLEESRALRDEMQKAGAGRVEMGMINTHIADLERYITMWNDHLDDKGKFEWGGATLVNENAQLDDLGAGMKQTGILADHAVGHLGSGTTGAITEHIQARGTGGGGSQTVVPRYKTTEQYMQAKGLEPLRAEPIPKGVSLTGQGPSLTGSQAAGPGGDQGSESPTLPFGEKTEVGRPSEGQLAEAQQRAAQRPQATGWAGGPNDAIHLEAAENEAVKRAYAQREMEDGHTPSIFLRQEGETVDTVAARYGHQNSLSNTRYDPTLDLATMQATRRELGEVTSGRSTTLQPSERVVTELANRYETARQNVAEAQEVFPDYWDRMPPETKAALHGEMEAGQGKGQDYWTNELRAYQTGRGASFGGSTTPDLPPAAVPPMIYIPASGPHVPPNGGDSTTQSASAGSATDGTAGGSAIRIKNIRMDASSAGNGGGMLDRFRSGIVTPIGMGTVIGLGLLGGFGGANVFATPAHVIQVPVVGLATQAPPPTGPLTITPITATLSADGMSTTFQVTATNVYGFQGTSWSLTPPSGAPDCNHLTMASGKATWLHGPNDGCGSFGGSATNIPGVAMVRVADGSGFHCTATYSGSLSGTGPAPTCQGGGPTMNPNFSLGGTSTGPTSTLVSKTVPGTLSVLGTVLGALFGAALGCWLLGAAIVTGRRPMTRSRIGDGVAIAGTPPTLADDAVPAVAPKPIMPAVGAKKKQRSCQNELNALNKANQALDKAKAAARAANDAVNAAKTAVDDATYAKSYADSQLDQLKSPTAGQAPPRVQEGGSLRQIVRRYDQDGNMLPPSADDAKTIDPAFSHVLTMGEAERNVEKTASDLADAQAALAAAQGTARAADRAVDAATKAFEDAREAYGKCLQLQREGL